MFQEEFNKLVDELLQASDLYYQDQKESFLTDEEYDSKLNLLENEVSKNQNLKTSAYLSLVEKVASGTSAKTNSTFKHDKPMLSLAKAKTQGELLEFLDKTDKFGASEKGWLVQAKMDGIALSIIYKFGKLSSIATRGNGTFGEDVTKILLNDNISIQGIPLNLQDYNSSEILEIRGEILMDNNDFEFSKNERYKKTGNNFSNPRNATAGIVNRKTEKMDFKAKLSFYCYTQIESKELILVTKKTEEVLGESAICLKKQDVLKKVELFGKIRESGKINFPTDGIVIKCVDNESITEKMGWTAHHPLSQLAFKYPSTQKETKVLNIEINVGRTGRLSLRAKVEPVELDGSIVGYASLHNFDWLKERDVRIGSKIIITKANDVIPYVVSTISIPENSARVVEPDVCPICNVELDKRTLLWRCPNDNCESRILTSLKTAVSKNYFNIEFLSEKTLEALIDNGKIQDIADIFTLTIEDLATLKTGEILKDGSPRVLGEKVAAKIYEQIEIAKTTPLDKVLASLNIPTLGIVGAKNLASHFETIVNILNAGLEEFNSIDLISEIKSEIIYKELQKKRSLIDKLKDNGVDMKWENSKISNVLENEIVVISGSIDGYNREEAKNLIESLGGKSSSSVSNNTTLVISDISSTSSKVLKAKELGIKILSPKDFLNQYL